MNPETVLAYSLVAALSIVSPGPAIVLALRNSIAFGVGSVAWSSIGNVTGLFCLSAAAMLGLGALLNSSAILFGVVKVVGALYLFYIGLRHLLGRSSVINMPTDSVLNAITPSPRQLFMEAFLMAVTNPKPILFFSALFPQFVNANAALVPQFFILTGIFMALSFSSLMAYAVAAKRARWWFVKPSFAKWIDRAVGTAFISFGAALLALRRPAA